MTEAAKFLFGRDFREEGRRRITDADLTEAEERGFARGLEVGMSQANAAIDARVAEASARIADAVGLLLRQADAEASANRLAATQLALLFARKLGGAAVERTPIATVAETAEACFAHLADVPHLVARVNETLVEETQAVLDRLASERGFTGRIIVLGEPEIAPGDARLEWAEGGVARDRAALEAAIEKAVTDWAENPASRR